jgi:hypothetical protein
MNEEDGYCGFLCQDVIDKQQEIIDELKEFSQHNPEFAIEMTQRIISMCMQARVDLQLEGSITTTD